MTLEEAEIIARICSEADGGCSVCVHGQAESLAFHFPEFSWLFQEYRNSPEIVEYTTDGEAGEAGSSSCNIFVRKGEASSDR